MKRRKVIQAHIDIINEIIEEIIQGKINAVEAAKYVNDKAVKAGIDSISQYTVPRIVEEILENDIKRLKLYRNNRKHNSGNRNPNKVSDEIKKQITEQELPKIMKNEINIVQVAQKYNMDERTARSIIEKHMQSDEEAYNEYKKTVYKNIGTSMEKREIAKQKKEDINNSNIVTNSEFLILSPEEQRKLVEIKFLKMKLKEKSNKGISNKEKVDKKVEELIEFFLSRNKKGEIKGNLTERDILYMIYRFPTMINYSINDKIDSIINCLETHEDIGYTNTNHIIKAFPAIIGYSIDRTKTQLKILSDNNLIDAVVECPRRFMQSPQLMHALIEFAKHRHKTNNLDGVKRSNIFMANSNMKRLYKTSYEDIKQEYPLKESFILDTQEIGRQTINEQKDTENKDKVDQEIERKLNKRKDELVEK